MEFEILKKFKRKILSRVRVIVPSATINNISDISQRSVLLVEETRTPRENHWPVASHWQTLSYNVVSSTSRLSGVRTHNVRGDRHWCIGSYKSKYHTIMTTTHTNHIKYKVIMFLFCTLIQLLVDIVNWIKMQHYCYIIYYYLNFLYNISVGEI